MQRDQSEPPSRCFSPTDRLPLDDDCAHRRAHEIATRRARHRGTASCGRGRKYGEYVTLGCRVQCRAISSLIRFAAALVLIRACNGSRSGHGHDLRTGDGFHRRCASLGRVGAHKSRYWFRRPLKNRGSWQSLPRSCRRIESSADRCWPSHGCAGGPNGRAETRRPRHAGRASSLGSRIRLKAALAKTKSQSTFGSPRSLTLRIQAIVFSHPKDGSMRGRAC